MFDLYRPAHVHAPACDVKSVNPVLISGHFKITASPKVYAKSPCTRMRVHVWTLHGVTTGRPQLNNIQKLRRTGCGRRVEFWTAARLDGPHTHGLHPVGHRWATRRRPPPSRRRRPPNSESDGRMLPAPSPHGWPIPPSQTGQPGGPVVHEV